MSIFEFDIPAEPGDQIVINLTSGGSPPTEPPPSGDGEALLDSDGLYEGTNSMPSVHYQNGLLAMSGFSRYEDRYLFFGFGFSNPNQEFQTATRDLWKVERHLRPVNLCFGGYDTARMAIDDPYDPKNYWVKARTRASMMGIPVEKVEVGWAKIALALGRDYPGISVEEYRHILYEKAVTMIQVMKRNFPWMRALFLSDRTYGGYAGGAGPNPEPYARATGDVVKKIVLAQVKGLDDRLAVVNDVPWLAWGPSLWADGMNARSDGLFWEPDDFELDGTHPSHEGEMKVARELDGFLRSQGELTSWFHNP